MPNFSSAGESITKGRSTVALKTRNPNLSVPKDKNLGKSFSIASLASSVQAATISIKDETKAVDVSDINAINEVSLNISQNQQVIQNSS